MAEKGKDGKVYCIGRGVAKPLWTYVLQIKDAVNPSLVVEFGSVPYTYQQVMYLCADNTDIVKDLGYTYQYTFYEGIIKTVEWCREHFDWRG